MVEKVLDLTKDRSNKKVISKKIVSKNKSIKPTNKNLKFKSTNKKVKEVKPLVKKSVNKGKEVKPLVKTPFVSKGTAAKEDKVGSRKILIIIMLIIGLALFLIGIFLLFIKLGFYIYQNVPGDPVSPNSSIDELPILNNINLNGVRQFYPNMKFNHNEITFNIGSGCSDEEKSKVFLAFDELDKVIDNLDFRQTQSNEPDIDIICSDGAPRSFEDSDFFVAGEGGAREVIQTGRYNVITSGAMYIYDDLKRSTRCDWPNVEVHELIHVFGFNHSTNENSLMYPYLETCSQRLDSSIIKELNRLYDEPNLPDLYFEDVSAIKKGRYLDFNITVKNSGVRDAKNSTFTVLDDGVEIETKKLKDLKYGAGIVMEVRNFKLKSRASKIIDIQIDYHDYIGEIDEGNNLAKIRF
ncbi:matrixin family metalloprotease [Candidatus Pacearchaeota archaeon]|nr:matrixin family metalloprotease [Candidatus Pacearchaeota archaeon]